MAIKKDDYALVFLGLGGEFIGHKVTPAKTKGDYAIPSLCSDGEYAGMKVAAMKTKDDVGFPALCSDGKYVGVRGGGGKKLSFTVAPTNIERDRDFSLTIEAQDSAGNIIASAADTISITLNNAQPGDKFTSPNPDSKTFTATLVSGTWSTTTEQITGGVGTASGVTITAVATGYDNGITASFSIFDALLSTYQITSSALTGDYATFNGIEYVSSLTNTYYTSNPGGTIGIPSISLELLPDNYWEIDYILATYGGYGTSYFQKIVFRATAATYSPVDSVYLYDRIEWSKYFPSPPAIYDGSGSTVVS